MPINCILARHASLNTSNRILSALAFQIAIKLIQFEFSLWYHFENTNINCQIITNYFIERAVFAEKSVEFRRNNHSA